MLGKQLPVVAVADFAGQATDELVRRVFVQRVARAKFRQTPAECDINKAIACRRRVRLGQVKIVKNTLCLRRQERVVRVDDEREEERPGRRDNGIDLVVGERATNIRTDTLVNIEIGNNGTGPFLLRCLQQVERVEVEQVGRVDDVTAAVTGKLDNTVAGRINCREVANQRAPWRRKRAARLQQSRRVRTASSRGRPGLTLPDRCSRY